MNLAYNSEGSNGGFAVGRAEELTELDNQKYETLVHHRRRPLLFNPPGFDRSGHHDLVQRDRFQRGRGSFCHLAILDLARRDVAGINRLAGGARALRQPAPGHTRFLAADRPGVRTDDGRLGGGRSMRCT